MEQQPEDDELVDVMEQEYRSGDELDNDQEIEIDVNLPSSSS